MNVSRQRGFSLLELLVALVVFSIGLLAVAGLQTVSKSTNFEGMQRTTAAQIASGLLEDMRMNGDTFSSITGVMNYAFNEMRLEPRSAADLVR